MSAMRDDVVWIGGSPCSGKSTVARTIAASRNVPLYGCDDAFERHAAMIEPAAGPTLKKVTAMSVADRLAQPIGIQIDDVFRLYREEFPLIVQDITETGGPMIVEGAAVLPELLAANEVPPHRAVWIVPTVDFQRFHYRRRPWARDLLAAVADPEQAFERWMQRDAAFATIIARQAHDLGYHVMTVDGVVTAADVATSVDALLPAARRF
jgi:dephospho-CoA kinase